MEAGTDHHLKAIKWHVNGLAIILSFGKKFLADCQHVALELPLKSRKDKHLFTQCGPTSRDDRLKWINTQGCVRCAN